MHKNRWYNGCCMVLTMTSTATQIFSKDWQTVWKERTISRFSTISMTIAKKIVTRKNCKKLEKQMASMGV